MAHSPTPLLAPDYASQSDIIAAILTARAAYELHNYDACLEQCQIILSLDAEYGEAHFLAGSCYDAKSDFRSAWRHYSEPIYSRYELFVTAEKFVKALMNDRKYDIALSKVNKIIVVEGISKENQEYFLAIRTAFVDRMIAEAKTLRTTKDYRACIKLCQILIKHMPHQGQAYYILGRCYMHLKNWPAAIHHLRQAFANDYYQFISACHLAEALQFNGELDAALAEVNVAIELKLIHDADYYYAPRIRAGIFAQMGEYTLAIMDLNAILTHITDTSFGTFKKKAAILSDIEDYQNRLKATAPDTSRPLAGSKRPRIDSPTTFAASSALNATNSGEPTASSN